MTDDDYRRVLTKLRHVAASQRLSNAAVRKIVSRETCKALGLDPFEDKRAHDRQRDARNSPASPDGSSAGGGA